ncbi:MAG TPA: hypothetical protein VGE39_08210 [Prosthecobacter sp.]
MNEEPPSCISPSDPWIAWGDDGANEDMLTGNKPGLLRLREAIDAAIENGEFFLPGDIGLSGVRMIEERPEWQSPNPCLERALTFGCLAVALLCGSIFLFGCAELVLKFF